MFLARHIALRARRTLFTPRRAVSERDALMSNVRQHTAVAARACVPRSAHLRLA